MVTPTADPARVTASTSPDHPFAATAGTRRPRPQRDQHESDPYHQGRTRAQWRDPADGRPRRGVSVPAGDPHDDRHGSQHSAEVLQMTRADGTSPHRMRGRTAAG